MYKAIYDITAKITHVWHNSKNHLEKAKNWAIYKALMDFKKDKDNLLLNINRGNGNLTSITYVESNPSF
jgi:hypothetical protein